jgi:hypothetical protein
MLSSVQLQMRILAHALGSMCLRICGVVHACVRVHWHADVSLCRTRSHVCRIGLLARTWRTWDAQVKDAIRLLVIAKKILAHWFHRCVYLWCAFTPVALVVAT